jgi:hypothetical protein
VSQTRKIGILRGRNNSTALALTPALDKACTEMLIQSVNPLRDSVLEYWTDNTDGFLQFDVTMMPWVDVSFFRSDADANGVISRHTQFA